MNPTNTFTNCVAITKPMLFAKYSAFYYMSLISNNSNME